jgi:vancomycin permeability regulator SanA
MLSLPTTVSSLYAFCKGHRRLIWTLAGSALASPLVAMLLGYAVIVPNQKYVLQSNNTQALKTHHAKVGLVLGAGITHDGKPYRELQARLDVAAAALQNGTVDKLLLSGDNRFKNYDEPTAMKNYLVSKKHIDPHKLQADFAGRSTYESCDRAAHVFNVHQTIIFSADSHLPRAIYLCRQFGIETYGIASNAEANNATRREAVARVKALYNVYVHGERTIMGPAISL